MAAEPWLRLGVRSHRKNPSVELSVPLYQNAIRTTRAESMLMEGLDPNVGSAIATRKTDLVRSRGTAGLLAKVDDKFVV